MSEDLSCTEPDAEELGRRRAKRAAVLVLGGWLSYLLLEVLLLPALGTYAPLRWRTWVPAPMTILGLPTKSGFLPQDYVLVVGDSYAEGQGDWLMEVMGEPGDPPYQATHVLHELTARDVIWFGRGGADNVSSTAFLTEKRFASLARVGLGPPRDVLVYFTENSDPADNLRHARRRLDLGPRAIDSYSDRELEQFVAVRAREGYWEGVWGTFFGPYVLANLVKGGGRPEWAGDSDITPWSPGDDADPGDNVFLAGGRTYRFARNAQGPALELEEGELVYNFRVLRHALAWIQRRFEGSSITLVYLPSQLACYEVVSPEVHARTCLERPGDFPSESIAPRSEELRRRARAVAEGLGIAFLDTTPGLQAAAREQLIHGPRDGKHLNRAGYTALGRILAEALGDGLLASRGSLVPAALHRATRHAGVDRVRRQLAADDRARAHDHVVADDAAGEERAVGADQHVVADADVGRLAHGGDRLPGLVVVGVGDDARPRPDGDVVAQGDLTALHVHEAERPEVRVAAHREAPLAVQDVGQVVERAALPAGEVAPVGEVHARVEVAVGPVQPAAQLGARARLARANGRGDQLPEQVGEAAHDSPGLHSSSTRQGRLMQRATASSAQGKPERPEGTGCVCVWNQRPVIVPTWR